MYKPDYSNLSLPETPPVRITANATVRPQPRSWDTIFPNVPLLKVFVHEHPIPRACVNCAFKKTTQ